MGLTRTRLLPDVGFLRKTALICAVFLVPVAFLAGFLIVEKRSAIEFSSKEIQGVHLLRALMALRLPLEQGATDFSAPLQAWRDARARHGSGMVLDPAAKALEDVEMIPTADALKVWADLYAAVGDQSNLILDPDLDSYYLMDLALLRLPAVMDELRSIEKEAADKRLSHQARAFELMARRQALELQDQGIDRGLEVAFAQTADAGLRGAMAPAKVEWRRSRLALASSLERCARFGSCSGLTAAVQDLRDANGSLWEASAVQLRQLLERRVGAMRQRMALALGLVLVVLVAALLLAWRLAASVVDPVRELATRVAAVVSEGDLSEMAPDPGLDEAGQLSRAVAALVAQLRQLPSALEQSTRHLGGAVKVLEASIDAQHAVLSRQASALQETQVTAEEIRQTSQVASRSAEKILGEIGRAESAGALGSQALEQSLQGLEAILGAARESARSIGELGDRTSQIGGITGTVKDLADQSNMLALNAAIEAVRSGEHGKGFALVAREIRRLADQSIQSTERVREILEGVRGAVGTAMAGSEDGARKVELSLEQMRASAEHLRSLAAVVQDSSSAVRQIATAVNQQNTGVNQVFAAVVDQNKMMEESVKQLEGTLKAVDSLKQVSSGLAAVLAKYKV